MNLQDSIKTKELTDTELVIYKMIKAKKEVSRDLQEVSQKLLSYRRQLQELLQLPLIKQRTDEWYEARKTRLTASDLDEATKDNNNRLAMKKAGVTEDTINYTTMAPLKWGTMFEPMAIRSYSQERDDIPVHEFGLIKHPFLDNFGASPDGINDLGIMIEIKCPYSRDIIDNSIPYKYYMQIQGQLAVCQLEQCDYIECDFETFVSVTRYKEVIDPDEKTKHGIIAEYKNRETDEFEYIYSREYTRPADAAADIEEKMKAFASTRPDILFIKLTPWRLKHINVQRVGFDKELWETTVPKITGFWNKVVAYKENKTDVPAKAPKAAKKTTKYVFISDEDS